MTRGLPRTGLAGLAPGAARALRMVFERLPSDTRSTIRAKRAVFRGLGQLKRNQAVLALRMAELELSARPEPVDGSAVVDPRFPPTVRSRICTQSQLREPWFAEWCSALGERPRANRKLWEHAYIAHVLDATGQLRAGCRGLGFGVGTEPLTALFASKGCSILATDLEPTAKEARVWSNTGQHAGGLAALHRPEICDRERFDQLVTWQPVDMRAVPADLGGFDFCWSACSFEHLGSLAAGLAFVEDSVRTLRPGGIAVHTTEFNLASDTDTVATGHTVLYRRSDLEALARRLGAHGHQVAAFDLRPGDGILDEYVDLPPYVSEPHLRLWYGKFTTTSVALVIRARPRDS